MKDFLLKWWRHDLLTVWIKRTFRTSGYGAWVCVAITDVLCPLVQLSNQCIGFNELYQLGVIQDQLLLLLGSTISMIVAWDLIYLNFFGQFCHRLLLLIIIGKFTCTHNLMKIELWSLLLLFTCVGFPRNFPLYVRDSLVTSSPKIR